MVKYQYLGFAYPYVVPEGWVPIVKQMFREIDKEIRPWYVPRFILNWIYWLAMEGSVVYTKNRFFYRLMERIPIFYKCRITDIKDKYAGLSISGAFSPEVQKIIDCADDKCDKTCEKCGSTKNVDLILIGSWWYNYCSDCVLIATNKRLRHFNTTYKDRIPERFYGASIPSIPVLSYLDKKFKEFEKEYPDFKFYQLKLKFGNPVLYIDNVPREKIFKIEEEIAEILKNEEKN